MSETRDRRDGTGREGMVFRYDRQRRLEKAPESVKWLASRGRAGPSSVFRGLFANRASRLLFITIVALVAAFNVAPLLSGPKASGKLGGDRYSAKAFWFEGRVLVSLSRSGALIEGGKGVALSVSARLGEGARGDAGGAGAAGGAALQASFVAGLSEAENFRLALDAPSGKPSLLSLRLSIGGAGLDLVAKVE